MTALTLAALLDNARSAPAIPDAAMLLVELREQLDDAARVATDALPDDHLPLRLPKERLAKVLACERHLLASAVRDPLSEPIVRGMVLDRLLHHHVHGEAVIHGPALAIAVGAFEAERADDVLAWLDDHVAMREGLAAEATQFAERLAGWGPIEAEWWPRCEQRLRVDLAGGRVLCAAHLDLVVGGGPTGLPVVIAEVKSGRFGQDHRDGLFWYALVAALRDGAPPAGVVGWSAWDGGGWWQPVTEHLLRAATHRATMALERLGELAGGRPPVATPCRACRWCTERQVCDAALPLDDLGDVDGW